MRSPCHIKPRPVRQKRRQCRWKIFGAFCLSCTLPSSIALLDTPRTKQDQERCASSISISSSKTKAAVRADGDLDSWNKSKKMIDQHDLAHHILSNSESNDFTNRLLEEITKEQSVGPTETTHDPLGSLLLYGLVTLALTSALLTPTIFADSIRNLFFSSVALLLPWLWIGRLSIFSKETVVMCITSFLHFVPRIESNNNVMFRRVVPVVLDSLKKMLIMEAWSRVWCIAGTSIANFFKKITLEHDNHGNTEQEKGMFPDFVYAVHEFLDTSIRKGANKAVTKTIERNVQAAIATTLSSVTTVVEQAVLPLILMPFAKGVVFFEKETPM